MSAPLRIRSSLCVTLSFLLSACAGSSPGSSAPMREDVERLLRVTGFEGFLPEMMEQMTAPLREINPEIPAALWDELISAFDFDEMLGRLVPVYERHFTHEEIRDLLVFYATPTGRKVIETLPAVTQESMAIGQAYGIEIVQRVIERLTEQGYEVRAGSTA